MEVVRWQLTTGQTALDQLLRHEEAGTEPPAYLFPPIQMSGTEDAFLAFNELSTERLSALGDHLPIPFRAILRWAERSGIETWDDQMEFVRMIRAMDRVWLEVTAPVDPTKPKKAQRSFSMGLFDALFGVKNGHS